MKEWVSNNWIQHSLQQSNKHMVKLRNFKQMQPGTQQGTIRAAAKDPEAKSWPFYMLCASLPEYDFVCVENKRL